MQINGLSSAQAAQSLSGIGRSATSGKSAPTSEVQGSSPADQLDLSPEAQALSQAQSTGETSSVEGIRWEKVNALRQAIAEGNYDSPDRVSGALDSFLDAYA